MISDNIGSEERHWHFMKTWERAKIQFECQFWGRTGILVFALEWIFHN